MLLVIIIIRQLKNDTNLFKKIFNGDILGS